MCSFETALALTRIDHQRALDGFRRSSSESYIVDIIDVLLAPSRLRETPWPGSHLSSRFLALMALLAASAAPASSARAIQVFLATLEAITEGVVIPTFIETALWGVFTLLIVISTYILIRWGMRTISSRIIFSLTILMYAMSTLIWAVDLAITRDELSLILPALLEPPPPATAKAISKIASLVATPVVPTIINIIVGDCIVLWRMCVVWSRNKMVIAISLVLGLLTTGFYIPYAIVQVVPELHAVNPSGSQTNVVAIVAYALSFISNIFATGMIAFKFWQHRMHLMKELRNRSTRSAMEGVLVLLIESGVIYTVLWVLYFASNAPGGISGTLGSSISLGMQQLTGMYPTLLVVIIALQKSKIDRYQRNLVTTKPYTDKFDIASSARGGTTTSASRTPPSPVSVILIGNPPETDTFYTTTEDAYADVEQHPLPPLPRS